MTHSIANLFDPRGGLLMAHVCEICGEPIAEDAVLSTCAECNHEEDDLCDPL